MESNQKLVMNYLAHFYLSYGDEEVLLGNFLGDFVRNKDLDSLPEKVQLGVKVHWEIDRFMDTHPIVKKSKEKLKRHSHYASVIIDVLYDHFLAKHWHQYHDEQLVKFSSDCYNVIEDRRELLNHKAAMLFYYMKKRDWIQYYPTVEGISGIFRSMAKRTPYDTSMGTAGIDLQNHYNDFEGEFLTYFPLIEKHVTDLIKAY